MPPEPNGTSGWIENSARVWKVEHRAVADLCENALGECELAFGGDSFVFFDDTLEANMGMVTSNCEDINVVN